MTYGDSAARKRAPRDFEVAISASFPNTLFQSCQPPGHKALGLQVPGAGGRAGNWLPPVPLILKDQGVRESPKPPTPTTPAVRRVPNPGMEGAAGIGGCRRSRRGNLETPRSWGLRWPDPRLPRVPAPAIPRGQRGPAAQPPRRGWDIKAGLE